MNKKIFWDFEKQPKYKMQKKTSRLNYKFESKMLKESFAFELLNLKSLSPNRETLH